MYVSDVEVLERGQCQSIESMIFQHQLRWSGHAEERLPKQLLYGEHVDGKRLAQKPKMRYKNCLETAVKKCSIGGVTWESKALDRGQWRKKCIMERTTVRMKG